MVLQVGQVASPFGPLWIAAIDEGLRVVTVPGGTREACVSLALRHAPSLSVADGGSVVREAAEQLSAYFAGELREFQLPLDPQGTPFQQRVWAAVAAIPYGSTMSYRAIAKQIGAPRAVRAVGAANGANPLAIIIPCHRVIGSDGTLTGYGGGLPMKRALLAFEAEQSGNGSGT